MDCGAEIGGTGVQRQAGGAAMIGAVGDAGGEVDVVQRQLGGVGQPGVERHHVLHVAGDEEFVAAHFVGVVDAAIDFQGGAGAVQGDGERPGAGQRGDGAALQARERAALQGAGERDAVGAAGHPAVHLGDAGLGADGERVDPGGDFGAGGRAVGDGAAIDADAADIDGVLAGMGVGLFGRGAFVERVAGLVHLPVGRAVGGRFLYRVLLVEGDFVDDDVPGLEGEQGQLGVGRIWW